jgi:hypothetical protein
MYANPQEWAEVVVMNGEEDMGTATVLVKELLSLPRRTVSASRRHASWLKVAADKPQGVQAFTAWLNQEAKKFPALRRVIGEPIQPERFSDRLRELEAFRPDFIQFERDDFKVDTPQGPKHYARLGGVSVDEDLLYQRAKEYGLSSTEASRRIGQFLGYLEQVLSVPMPHRQWPSKDPREVGLPKHMAPHRPVLPEEEIERGGVPTKAVPPSPIRTPEEQRAGQTVAQFGERLRKLIERTPTPTTPEGTPEGAEVPEVIEDIPRRRRRDPLDALSEEERQEADEIMREMVQEGLVAAPEKTPETRGDLTEWWKELIEVGGAATPGTLVQRVRDARQVVAKIQVD